MDERTVPPTSAQLALAALDKSHWEAALAAILRIESEALGVDRASFWSMSQRPPGIVCELGYVASVDALERGARIYAADSQSYTSELGRARVMAMDDIAHDPRTADLLDYCRARRIRAMLDVPVWVAGALAGVLCHEHVGGPRHWTDGEIELALAAGTAVSVALEARQRVRAEAGERRARFLAEASHRLTCALDEHEVARRAVDLLLPHAADWAALDLFDGDRVTRVAMAHADPAKRPAVDDYLARFPPRADAAHATVLAHRLRQAAVVPDVTDERLRTMGFRDDHRAAIEQLGTRSVILVPFCNHVVDGVILMASSQRSYDADDLALAEDYRERVANALTNARLYSRSLAALRARDEFLRVASHELRTPLTALQFACERLASASHGVTRDMAATAERALRASRRLGRLVTHMLEAVEVEQQRPTIEPARVDLVPVVREAVGDLLQTKRGSVVVELALPDKLVGEWDDDRVQEIVINLVDNALRYGNGEPVRVELDRDGGDAVLAVADHGPGIAPELLPNLFEPYERGPANAHAGLGLGLFIVKQLVDAQHGSIDVRSRPGEGARFTVRLPGAT